MKETIKEIAKRLNKQFDVIEDVLLDISLNKALSLVVHIICIITMILGAMLLGSALLLISMAVKIHYVYSSIASIKIIVYLTVGSVLAVSSLYCMVKLNEYYRKAESVFLQKKRKLFEPYIEPKNDEVTEEQLIKEGNEIGGYYDDLRERMEL